MDGGELSQWRFVLVDSYSSGEFSRGGVSLWGVVLVESHPGWDSSRWE